MDYSYSKTLLLRSPSLSIKNYSLSLDSLLKNPNLKSIFFASPALYKLLEQKKFDPLLLTDGQIKSILRYFNRMCFRPTPFGTFASFTTIEWGEKEAIVLESPANFKTHISFDQTYLKPLAERINNLNINQKHYLLNPALYPWSKDYRFIKTSFSDNSPQIFFDLESFERNKLTTGILDYLHSGRKKGDEIIGLIRSITGCDEDTASDYLTFLVTAGIVISDTSINIIGQDYLERMLDQASEPNRFQKVFGDILQNLKKVEIHDLAALISISGRLNELLGINEEQQPKQYFYAGLESKIRSGCLGTDHQNDLRDGLKAMSVLVAPQQPAMLQDFINAFRLKYDKQKISLLQALDPDIGIGYGSLENVENETDLLRDVKFMSRQANQNSVVWSGVHRMLLSKWTAGKPNSNRIDLTDEDLSLLNKTQALPSPPTISVLFRVLEDGTYLESVGGVTATALLGRFAAWSKDVLSLTKSMVNEEQRANPNVIFADIGQLSDQHADNINRRPHSYEYEIPINVVSTLPVEKQIALPDLWLSVVGDQLVLESRRLNKVIIPRLSSAYNFNRNHLAIFRLLCDLQYQGVQGSYTFHLENFFSGMPAYPRVTYKHAILSLASWHLSADEVDLLKRSKEDPAIKIFNELKEKRNLPQFISLSNFDQQLVFDLENMEEVKLLLDSLKRGSPAVLQEFIRPAPIVLDHTGSQTMVNQFVASLFKTKEVYPGIRADAPLRDSHIPSDYVLGSKWLYLKFYCNPAIANELLVKKLLPYLSQIDKGQFHSWFFIRYRDSAYHIRLRLHIEENAIGLVLSGLKKRINSTVKYHLIREYQADIYKREMERYGADLIESVEGMFYGSSELVVNFIKKTYLKTFAYSYHSLAFVSVVQLLEAFIPDIDEQISFLEQMVNIFYAEFSSDKTLKVDLDLKFRELRAEVGLLLGDEMFYDKLGLRYSANLFTLHLNNVRRRSAQFESKRNTQLLADLVHMHINRLFVDRQRNNELVVYYVLYKYFQSHRAKNKTNR
ncbi:lantibiotic dehydratase [Mucilaginibacter terrae]|uniref:Thiopeptide-type bacteriocin biosynthesis protein n=1 Tax=Mucilaginibacter terrae TaxID=1955052 RepID=A0ABU3GMN5_9SPHI|nr:lantibiotic dehydratase [Mucilaginibacter terrae]MDT3401044.1 thiopeptide-type bacteriocin biosynthesis protein [Mucilaginibacter terrae]